MDYKRGDIVLVNFNPQRKAEEVGKIRPAIILSDSDLNQILDLITVIPLTTNLIDDALPLRVRIKKRDDLKSDSDAMVENIRAVSKSRVLKRLSELDDKELGLIESGVKKLFCLY
jgi:mRNA interferase MazF